MPIKLKKPNTSNLPAFKCQTFFQQFSWTIRFVTHSSTWFLQNSACLSYFPCFNRKQEKKNTPYLPPLVSPLLPPPCKKTMDAGELSRIFEIFDRNGDGKITKKELKISLENMGIFIQNNELRQMIEKIDINGDGCVDIAEFGSLYKSIMEDAKHKQVGEEAGEEDMKEAFNVFDQNGDGFITVEELRLVLSRLGLKQGSNAADCRKMITNIDVDGNGMVDYNEFKKMMRSGGDGFAAFA